MKNVITVSREFGSAGRSIAKLAAEKLGYHYYDKEIIEKIVEETGLSTEFVEKKGEYASGKNILSYAFIGRMTTGESIDDIVWKKQREIILKLAEEGKCVIVGRCADYILRDREDCLNVFIHASLEFRKKRIVEVYGETDEIPERRIRDKDKKRSINYKYYTDQTWGNISNYHLTLDSSVIGIENSADVIASLAKTL